MKGIFKRFSAGATGAGAKKSPVRKRSIIKG
jgi:hypothetical protein